MKELHNNIFSTTTCISKETMLKYINKQLNKAELYDVEKHLLDCELCADAMEGMKYAKNSSMIFAINHQIDKRVKKNGGKFTVLKNLMLAASVIVIVFGAFFTFNFLNKSLKNKADLAIVNETDKTTPKENTENKLNELTIQNEEQAISSKVAENQQKNERQVNTTSLSNNQVFKESVAEKNKVFKDILLNEDEDQTVEEDLSIAESSAPLEETVDFSQQQHAIDNKTVAAKVTDLSIGGNIDRKKSKSKKTSHGTRVQQSSIKSNEATFTTSYNKQKKLHKIDYIETYKVVDYTVDYQNEEDFKKEAEPVSVSPDFATKADKDLADKEVENSIIKITYKQTLKLGIHQFNLTQYKAALIQFNLILAKHPKDVNALFYAGLSYYNLKNYKQALTQLNNVLSNKEVVFNQEAKWYKALSLVNLNETKKAKKLLKQIISEDGFYKTQATEKLKAL